MGLERAARWAMVDRCERRQIQDGKGKDRQSERDFCGERQGLGRRFQWKTRRHLGLYDWPLEKSRRSGCGEKARRDLPLEFRLGANSHVRSWIGFLRLVHTEKIEV